MHYSIFTPCGCRQSPDSRGCRWEWNATMVWFLNGIALLKMAKSHVFLVMQISYPYIVWNNFPKFQENRASNFRDMRQSMCIIVVWGNYPRGEGGSHKLDRYPFRKMDFFFLWWILKFLKLGGPGERARCG